MTSSDKPQVWLAFSMMSDDFIHFPEGGYVDDIALKTLHQSRRGPGPAAR